MAAATGMAKEEEVKILLIMGARSTGDMTGQGAGSITGMAGGITGGTIKGITLMLRNITGDTADIIKRMFINTAGDIKDMVIITEKGNAIVNTITGMDADHLALL